MAWEEPLAMGLALATCCSSFWSNAAPGCWPP